MSHHDAMLMSGGLASRPAGARAVVEAAPAAQPALAPAQQQSRVLAVAVDLTAGTAAGIAQLLVGHPFDTIKVKLQTQGGGATGGASFVGPLDATRQTLANEGLKGLYKGVSAPLATVALFNAILFASRGAAESALAHADGSPLQLPDRLLAAVAASMAVSLVATPTELCKCRLQAQGCSAPARARLLAAGLDPAAHTIYTGPRDVARHVLRAEGGVHGLYKGLGATLGREVVGNVAMFGTYELVKQQLAQHKGLASTSQLSFGDLLLAGGVGGVAFWLGCYPADIVKSKLQVDSFAAPRYASALDCARQLVAAHGLRRGLYAGFTPALARSFPANAACFAVYEATKAWIDAALAPSALSGATA